jgi:hypothetical protein
MSLWSLDLRGRCTYPRYFLEVCQRKGDAGPSVRKCLKTNGMDNWVLELVRRTGDVTSRFEEVSSVHAGLYIIWLSKSTINYSE